MVTAETAVVLPVLLLVLAGAVAAVTVVGAQLRCVDAAREGARAAARGESVAVVTGLAGRAAPEGAVTTVSPDAEEVRVTVSARITPLGRSRCGSRSRPKPCAAGAGAARAGAAGARAPGAGRGAVMTGQRRAGERGSATVWVLALSAVLAVVGAAVVLVGAAVVARHRAAAAADLGALAAAGRAVAGDPGRLCRCRADRCGQRGGGRPRAPSTTERSSRSRSASGSSSAGWASTRPPGGPAPAPWHPGSPRAAVDGHAERCSCTTSHLPSPSRRNTIVSRSCRRSARHGWRRWCAPRASARRGRRTPARPCRPSCSPPPGSRRP